MTRERKTLRKLEFYKLLTTLKEEHWELKEALKRLESASDEEDAEKVAAITEVLDGLLRQHIIDEEAQILKLLIAAYGTEGAERAIQIFQQHHPIYHLFEDIKATAPYSYELLESKTAHLEKLLDDHCLLEEKDIFPWAEATYKKSEQPTKHTIDEMRWEK